MYTDQDLTDAVGQGIFSESSVQQFRQYIALNNNTNPVDEENFRLISGLNDIFVVIASGLLLVSIAWLGSTISPWIGALAFAAGAWALAEFFVLKRRMALPAIGLLLAFLGGVFAVPILFNGAGLYQPTEMILVASGVLTSIAARAHWLRFKVPITVAAGTAAGVACILAIILAVLPAVKMWLLPLVFVAGLFTFGLAMVWDAGDRSRQTRHSDVAFWLHLVSAPMIVHPIFSSLGILQGVQSVSSSLSVLILYVVLAMISIAVDRRAIMVSALVYVVYAFSSLLDNYGMVSYSFAVTGLCIGATLLLLSAFWQVSRRSVLKLIPNKFQLHLPEPKAGNLK
ncbi:MAG: hypothetical protein ACI8R8_003431 [Paraglaciecola sp.]|jgi:hypothetical protein